MAHIRKYRGRFQVQVEKLGVRDSGTFDSWSEANAWGSRRELEILDGSGKKLAKHTLHEALRKYSTDVAPKRNGCRWEQIRVKRFESELDDLPLSEMTTAAVADWRDRMLKKKKGASVRRDMEMLRTVLEVARLEWKWLKTNPCTDAKKPPKAPPRTRIITAHEIKEVCLELGYSETCAIVTKRQETALAFHISLETGMRAGEVRAAKVEGRVAHLAATKNGDPRDVPLSKRAVALYKRLPAGFTVSAGTMDAAFRHARDAAGLKGFTYHDSRHNACTRMAKIPEMTVLTLAKIIGHRDLKSLMIYFNPTADELAEMLG